MIIIGVVVAVWLTGRRLRARGTDPAFATDAAVWGVVGGIVGARLYHVFTSPQAYFGEHGDLVRVLYVWNGGLGIWGAVAGGALAVWLRCRRGILVRDEAGDVVRDEAGGVVREQVPFLFFADAAAPGLIFAQAIGRWGNYFNQELFGRPTTLPWGLKIDLAHRPLGYAQYATFHPTFLYESIWNVLVGAALLVIDRRRRLGRGRLFALYVMLYTVGRGLIEALRIDDAEHVLGLRLNDWTSFVVYAGGLAMFLLIRKPADEDRPFVPAAVPGSGDAAGDATGAAPAGDDEPAAGAAGATGAEATGATEVPDATEVPVPVPVPDATGSAGDGSEAAGDAAAQDDAVPAGVATTGAPGGAAEGGDEAAGPGRRDV
jgi:prolipoprotein diacylglyceryl transferase